MTEKPGERVHRPWRHVVIPQASHQIAAGHPGWLNELLLDRLRQA
jgi:hypothetical protein